MPSHRPAVALILALACLAAGAAHAAGQLVVEQAWVRAAPPGAAMLAGYARLSNRGDEAISIESVDSPAFAHASLHETRVENGVSGMRALPALVLAPGASVELAPGGKHVMLMQPKTELASGAHVLLEFVLGDKRRVAADFVVADAAPAEAPH